MTKIIINILFLLLLTQLLYPVNFSEFSYESNEFAGTTLKLTNDLNIEFDDWGIYDLLIIKSHSSDKPFYRTYLNNYTRNLFRVSKFNTNYYISTWFSKELNTSDTYANEFIGLEGDFELTDGISSGLDISWKSSSLELKLYNKYVGRNYKFLNTTTNEFDEEYSGDVIASGKVTYNYSKLWHPFIDFFHFNDLNENNYLGYSKFSAGIKYKNKFMRKYILKEQVSIGYTDLYESIPYFIQSETRISAKIGQKWMGYSSIYFQLFADDELATLYSGNSFTEFIVQRNFSIDKDNYFARVRTGIIINPVDHSLVIKSSFVYPYKSFELNGEYKFYPGDENAFSKEHSINAGCNYYLSNKTIQVSYNLGYVTYKNNYSNLVGQDHEMSHKIIFDLNL